MWRSIVHDRGGRGIDAMLTNKIHQILISDHQAGAAPLSALLQRNIASLKDTYPEATYRLYENEELLDFIAGTYPAEVLQAYRALRPYAFKADLARYCLLFEHGGLYADLSYLHLRPVSFGKRTSLVVFRDIAGHPSWAVSTSLLAAVPKHPVFARAIDRIVAHFRTGYYGASPLEPTGPHMLGRVVAETEDWRSIVFGDSRVPGTLADRAPNVIKLMPSGQVVAMRNKMQNARISDLVPGGGNDYNRLWRERSIWGETKASGLVNRVRRKLSRRSP